MNVSTRSRPKAAGCCHRLISLSNLFQHAAARRRLVISISLTDKRGFVSTRSRPKAAGRHILKLPPSILVSTRSRPKAAGFGTAAKKSTQAWFQHAAARRRLDDHDAGAGGASRVSTRSRPKAAGIVEEYGAAVLIVSTRSRPKAAG